MVENILNGKDHEKALKIIGAARQKVKNSETYKDFCKEYVLEEDYIDYIPMCFAELPVSARTENGIIYFNKKLINDIDDVAHYMMHEITHTAQQCFSTEPTESVDKDSYLDDENEQESFQNQTEFIEELESPAAADAYVDRVLDHHNVKDEEEREERKLELKGLFTDLYLKKTAEKQGLKIITLEAGDDLRKYEDQIISLLKQRYEEELGYKGINKLLSHFDNVWCFISKIWLIVDEGEVLSVAGRDHKNRLKFFASKPSKNIGKNYNSFKLLYKEIFSSNIYAEVSLDLFNKIIRLHQLISKKEPGLDIFIFAAESAAKILPGRFVYIHDNGVIYQKRVVGAGTFANKILIGSVESVQGERGYTSFKEASAEATYRNVIIRGDYSGGIEEYDFDEDKWGGDITKTEHRKEELLKRSFEIFAARREQKEGIISKDIFNTLSPFAKTPAEYFIHFTDSDMYMGVNIKTEYETPLGIYTYPLDENVLMKVANGRIEFAGNRKYVIVVKPKNTEKLIYSSTYDENNYDKDILKLTEIYGKVHDRKKRQVGTFIKGVLDAPSKNLVNTPLGHLFYIGRMLAKNASEYRKFFVDLGYDGIVDDIGSGVIHENEPKQAVFFSSSAMDVVEMFENRAKPKRKALRTRDLKKLYDNLEYIDLSDRRVSRQIAPHVFKDLQDWKNGKLDRLKEEIYDFSQKYSLIPEEFKTLEEYKDYSKKIIRLKKEYNNFEAKINYVIDQISLFNMLKPNEAKEILNMFDISKIFYEYPPFDLNWVEIASFSLPADFIRKYKDYLIWSVLSEHQKWTRELVIEFKDYINFGMLSENNKYIINDFDFVDKNKDYLDWYEISRRDISEDFMSRFKDNILWGIISREHSTTGEPRDLSENFIRKYQEYLSKAYPDGTTIWANISRYQNLSSEFIEEFKDKLDYRGLMVNTKLSNDLKNETIPEIYGKKPPQTDVNTDVFQYDLAESNKSLLQKLSSNINKKALFEPIDIPWVHDMAKSYYSSAVSHKMNTKKKMHDYLYNEMDQGASVHMDSKVAQFIETANAGEFFQNVSYDGLPQFHHDTFAIYVGITSESDNKSYEVRYSSPIEGFLGTKGSKEEVKEYYETKLRPILGDKLDRMNKIYSKHSFLDKDAISNIDNIIELANSNIGEDITTKDKQCFVVSLGYILDALAKSGYMPEGEDINDIYKALTAGWRGSNKWPDYINICLLMSEKEGGKPKFAPNFWSGNAVGYWEPHKKYIWVYCPSEVYNIGEYEQNLVHISNTIRHESQHLMQDLLKSIRLGEKWKMPLAGLPAKKEKEKYFNIHGSLQDEKFWKGLFEDAISPEYAVKKEKRKGGEEENVIVKRQKNIDLITYLSHLDDLTADLTPTEEAAFNYYIDEINKITTKAHNLRGILSKAPNSPAAKQMYEKNLATNKKEYGDVVERIKILLNVGGEINNKDFWDTLYRFKDENWPEKGVPKEEWRRKAQNVAIEKLEKWLNFPFRTQEEIIKIDKIWPEIFAALREDDRNKFDKNVTELQTLFNSFKKPKLVHGRRDIEFYTDLQDSIEVFFRDINVDYVTPKIKNEYLKFFIGVPNKYFEALEDFGPWAESQKEAFYNNAKNSVQKNIFYLLKDTAPEKYRKAVDALVKEFRKREGTPTELPFRERLKHYKTKKHDEEPVTLRREDISIEPEPETVRYK